MKVFLSWSGELSHKVALAFRDWLPSVIQSIEPYVSSEDIDKGARWSAEMAEELEKSRYGIICITKENVGKPWINFEAGALSRSIEKSTVQAFSSAVSPFLFDLKSSDLEGPLTQFQYVVNERSDILKLISSVNSKVEVNQLSPEKVEKTFERWWPDLRDALAKIATEGLVSSEPRTPARKPEEILNELLELVRSQQRLMVSKDDLVQLVASLSAPIRAEIAPGVRQSGFGPGFGTSGFASPGMFRSLLTHGVLYPEFNVNTTPPAVAQTLPEPTAIVGVRTSAGISSPEASNRTEKHEKESKDESGDNKNDG